MHSSRDRARSVMPQWAFWCTTALYGVLVTAQGLTLPAQVPSAFGLDGSEGGFSSRGHYVGVAATVGLVAVVGIVAMAAAVRRAGIRRETAELRPLEAERDRTLTGTVWVLGVVTMLFMCWLLHIAGVAARAGGPVPMSFPILVLVYAVFSTAWAVWVLRKLSVREPAVEAPTS